MAEKKITGEIIKPYWWLFNRDDVITVINPLDYDYQFGSEGEMYIVPKGDTCPIPGYMANVYVKGIVDELMQKDNKLTQMTDKLHREEYVSKVVVHVKESLKAVSERMQEDEAERKPIVLSGKLAGADFGQAKEVAVDLTPDSGQPITNEELDKLLPEKKNENLVPKKEFPSLKGDK